MARKNDKQETGNGDAAPDATTDATTDAAWQRLTQATNPLPRESRNRHIKRVQYGAAKGPARVKAKTAAAADGLGKKPRQKPAPPAFAATPPPHANLMPRTRRRLARGTLPIAARLDLHGLNLAEAERALSAFVMQARAQGQIWLLVITGKGARGEGKLRRAFPDWLARGALAGLVVEYGPAAANHGGAGAFYLRLRRAPSKA